ncbi:MAG: hypothetical protein IJW18_03290 [Lachnospiraceae bacterium]|nr:hypothetical protein [Lachnospiraceae bacterium]
MKKKTFAKVLVTLIALAAIVAGAIAIYRKFFCLPDEDCDFFDDENDIPQPSDTTKRGYVNVPLDNEPDYDADMDVVEDEEL